MNGFLSDPFTLTRGVCQGYPLSMLLYIIVAEVLAIFIDADTRSKGIQIGDHEMKILRDINCLTRIQLILKLYEKVSSSKIISKNQACQLGHIKYIW